MIILSWNIRGLGAKIKRSSIRNLINKHHPQVVFIQESKIENLTQKTINSIWKDSQIKWASSPSQGNSGGIVSLWDSSFFQLELLESEKHWIAISGHIPSIDLKCSLINIYCPCTIDERASVWQSIAEYQRSSQLPCLILGDYNEVLDPSDRGSQFFSTNGLRDFKAFLQEMQVVEVPSSNGKFTWFRGHAKSKLDRLFVSPEWILAYPSIKVTLLKRTISDHCPLLVSSREKNWGPKPFRFLNCWLSDPGCLRIIKDSWSSKGSAAITDKLKLVKNNLRAWNLAVFGKIDEQIQTFEDKIHDIDMEANIRNLSDTEVSLRKNFQIELWSWMRRKESYWAQVSRVKWIKEGDRNTRYFHTVASMRRRKNSIECIKVGNQSHEDPDAIKAEAVNFFSSIFKEEHQQRPIFNNLDFKTLSIEQGERLVEPFSHEEIDQAVASCDGSKAPGPDGFNFSFIKSSWEIIKNDVYLIIQEFWKNSKLHKGCNSAFIALIPKIESPNGFKDFRPISMVGCMYKILAKILARRLQKVIGSIIGPQQSSFIKGRQILDGALIASELIDTCKRNNTEAVVLKLDFHKAFDSLSWNYLDWVLSEMKFPHKWRRWIQECISSASAAILINGSPSPFFKLQRGLRQGDPLSPFLFNIAVEPLNLLFNKAVSLDLWSGIEVCRRGSKISHLQYADDTIVFCVPKLHSLMNIKKVLILFELSSGLQVNFHKSSVLGLNVDSSWLNLASSSLQCRIGSFPFIYLGLPIGGNTSRLLVWEPILDRMRKKLASWKGNLLSVGGRATLIKATLSSLPLYYMSIFPAPMGVIEKIIQIQRDFFWSGSMDKKRLAPAAWCLMELPKSLGGLGFGNLLHKNLGLLAKWTWRYLNEPQSLWRAVVSEKYKYEAPFCISDLLIPRAGGPWRSICAALLKHPPSKMLLLSSIRKKIGNGLNSFFWHDSWIGHAPLKSICPRLFLISSHKNASVASCCFWNGKNWNWALSWTRSLRPQDTCEFQRLMEMLAQVSLSPRDEDSFIWIPHKKGWFSVKSFCLELAKASIEQPQVSLSGMWKNLVPYRIEIFTWLALRGKLNTKDRLVRLRIVDPINSLCVLCNSWEESCCHLFLHCPVASSLWSWWLQIWRICWVFPATPMEAFVQWKFPKQGEFGKKVWMASFFVIIWTLWNERNLRCFENSSRSISQMQELVIMRLCWWIKGWGSDFPYGPNEVLKFPSCLDWNQVSSSLKSCLIDQPPRQWSPPPSLTVKWNVDASLKITSSKSAIGGVLRDCNGKFLCLFSSPIPFMEINHAEIFAIQRAIKISAACSRLSSLKIIVESDSLNAVNWCNGVSCGPWNLNFTLNFIKGEMSRGQGIEIVFKSRESNIVADSLAKQGLTRRDEFIAWL